jgi:tripartite motif-containing protein 37
VGEISQALEKLEVKKPESGDKCDRHSAPILYFCKTCTTAICSDCAMIESTHRGHEFEHLKSVYEKHVDKVKTEAKGLTKRLRELALLFHSVDTNIERVRKSKEDKSQEILLVVERMQAKLEEELKKKMTCLHKQRGVISQEIEYLESMHVELKRQLNSSARSSLIAKTPDLLQMLKDVYEKPVASYTGAPIAPDFSSEIVPDYDAAVFTLQNYSMLKESSEVVYSDTLKSNGLTWRLKVYPNGNGLVRGAYLSVFLEMLKGLQDSSKYYYRVELVNHRSPNLCVVREFASDFESGECWGYNRFYRIDLLEEEGYLDPDTDTLVLRFFVRAENYSQQCRDQKAYIAYLEQSRVGALEQIAELKQQRRENRGSVLNSNENPLAKMGEDEDPEEPKYEGDRSLQWDQDSCSEELNTSRLISHEDEETKSLEDLSLAVTEARKDLALMFKEYMISPVASDTTSLSGLMTSLSSKTQCLMSSLTKTSRIHRGTGSLQALRETAWGRA